MRKREVFRLSRSFLDGYKLFMKNEIDTRELKKRVKIPDDVIFFQEECDYSCNIMKEFKMMLYIKLDTLIEIILSEMEKSAGILRRAIIQKVLTVFLGTYSCYSKGEKNKRCKELYHYFISSTGDIPLGDKLNHKILEIMDLLLSSRELVEDEETLIRPIIFKLISIYIGLSISDRRGAIKCKDLGKELSLNWKKNTPELVTLSYLKKRVKNSKLPIDEYDLLEKYSF